MSNNDDWLNKLEKVIQYMANNGGKRPPKKEPDIGSWFSDQLGFYRKGKGASRAGMWFNEVREKAWAEFMEKYEDELLTKDEIWDKKLHMLEQFIQTYNRKPSETGDEAEVALLRWSYDQVKRAKPSTDRHKKWTAFTEKYSELYLSYDDAWNKTFDEFVAFVKENGQTPKQDGESEEERRLSRWMTRQNMNTELAGERLEKWEWFKMEMTNATVESTVTESTVVHSKEKCQGKDRNGNRCRNYPEEGMIFCKRAHLYMADYTPEQLANLRFCKGCLKWKDMPVDKNQCVACAERGKTNRETARATVVLCKAVDCTYKKSDENDYCGIHQINVFVDECAAEGSRPCRRYLHGCREKLTKNYVLSSCMKCLKVEREQDNARRGKVDPSYIVRSENYEETKQCTVCRAWKPLSDYTNRNNSNVTLTCLSCRDNFLVANANRDMEHRREQERIAARKPERLATKKLWDDANQYKRALMLLKYRSRVHKDTSDISYEQFVEIVNKPCYYCTYIEARGFNTVDRLDSTIGYLIDNCVSSCEVCNLMKGANDPITFSQRVEHILTVNNIIDGNKYPSAFAQCTRPNYNKYVKNAVQRNYEFNISNEMFISIIDDACYLCKKSPSNGIDRYDNNIGYTNDNVRPCCGQCNIMKKDMNYNAFMQKLSQIYKHTSTKPIDYSGNIITHILNRNVEKLTADEIKEKARVKKQKQRDTQKEKVQNIIEKKQFTIEEKREKERLKKQKQREEQKNTKPVVEKKVDSVEAKREKERLKKQKQRERAKLEVNNNDTNNSVV